MSDDIFLLIPDQSEDYPVEIHSFRDPLAKSSNSSLVNLDSWHYQARWLWRRIFKWRFCAGKAQSAWENCGNPTGPTLGSTLHNAIIDLVRKIIPTEMLVTTDSPQKRGRRDYTDLFETHNFNSLGIMAWFVPLRPGPQQYLTLQVITKRDQPSLWMGNYLKVDKSSQMRCTYFKPARNNANLCWLLMVFSRTKSRSPSQIRTQKVPDHSWENPLLSSAISFGWRIS